MKYQQQITKGAAQNINAQQILKGIEGMEAVQKINLKELCNRDPIKSSVSPKPDKRKRSRK